MRATTVKQKDNKYYLVEIIFDYKESCHHIYKHLNVKINGKNSNVVGLKKFIDENEIPSIFIEKTFFWTPGASSKNRRANERRHAKAFEEFANKFFDGVDNKMITSELGFDGDFYILNNSGKYYLGTNDLNKVERKINELRSKLIEQEAQMS